MWTTDQMRDLFDFLRWGDLQMLEAASKLSDDEYMKPRGISMGSIHNLLVHAMAAEWLWLQRWEGKHPTRIEDHKDYATRESLGNRWPVVHLGLSQFLDNQTATSLQAPFTYQTMGTGEIVSGALGVFLFHVVGQGGYERG